MPERACVSGSAREVPICAGAHARCLCHPLILPGAEAGGSAWVWGVVKARLRAPPRAAARGRAAAALLSLGAVRL